MSSEDKTKVIEISGSLDDTSRPQTYSAAGALGPAPQPYHGNRLAVVVTMALLAATLLTAAVLVVLAMR